MSSDVITGQEKRARDRRCLTPVLRCMLLKIKIMAIATGVDEIVRKTSVSMPFSVQNSSKLNQNRAVSAFLCLHQGSTAVLHRTERSGAKSGKRLTRSVPDRVIRRADFRVRCARLLDASIPPVRVLTDLRQATSGCRNQLYSSAHRCFFLPRSIGMM